MPLQPDARAAPQVFINGAAAQQLTRDLTSITVHVIDGRATAEIEVVDPPLDAQLTRIDVETTIMAIRLSTGEEAFSGQLTEKETRMLPGAAPSTVLYAAGTAPDADPGPAIPLHFGVEIESGSVRRQAHGSTAHCVAVALGLRCGIRINLTTLDPDFDGPFEVVELWHRFDLARGLRVEFIATA